MAWAGGPRGTGRITEEPRGHGLVGDHICEVSLCHPTPAWPWARCGSGEGTQSDECRKQNQLGRGSRKMRQDRGSARDDDVMVTRKKC